MKLQKPTHGKQRENMLRNVMYRFHLQEEHNYRRINLAHHDVWIFEVRPSGGQQEFFQFP